MPPKKVPEFDPKGLLFGQMSVLNRILKFKDDTVLELPSGDYKIEFLETRLELLENLWDDFYAKHDQLVLFEDDLQDQEYFVQEGYVSGQKTFVDTKAFLKSQIKRYAGVAVGVNRDQIAPQVSTASQGGHWQRFDVPKFSGLQKDWESWKEIFTTTVIEDSTLTDVKRVHLLANAMEDGAKSVLRGTRLTAENFRTAWEKVLRRFDDKDVRLFGHLEDIINAPGMSKKSSEELSKLVDIAAESFKGLEELKCPVAHYDIWFVHLIVKKLDHDTRESWNIHKESMLGFPTYKDLIKFLENRMHTLDQTARGSEISQKKSQSGSKVQAHVAVQEKPNVSCLYCNGTSHSLVNRMKLRALDVDDRQAHIVKLRLCFNCLGRHYFKNCKSREKCIVCARRHHVLLHRDKGVQKTQKQSCSAAKSKSDSGTDSMENLQDREDGNSSKGSGSHNVTTNSIFFSDVLLATAKITLQSENRSIEARAFIDPGSQCSFVTEEVAKVLNLKLTLVNVSISGVGGATLTESRQQSVVRLHSKNSDFLLDVGVLVLKKLTSYLPKGSKVNMDVSYLKDLSLADSDFASANKIDMIIGADVYPMILLGGLKKGPVGAPVAQETVLGWIVTGPVSNSSLTSEVLVHSVTMNAVVEDNFEMTNVELSLRLRKLWELDNIPTKKALTQEEEQCENLFVNTFSRNPDGRYVVRLPFRKLPDFPNSRKIALSQIYRLKQKFETNHELKVEYDKFMQDYLDLNHMEFVPKEEIFDRNCYYVPHHAIFRNKKIRVVFNASFPNANRETLNDCFLIGPKLQTDPRLIIIAWRFYKFVFSTDMVKMYRQIQIQMQDINWLRILYIFDGIIKDCRLKTVTYGTSCAPYLALRVMLQAILDIGPRYPGIILFLEKSRYIDDIFVGAHSLSELQELAQE